ncbi:transcription factor 7-like 1-A isoform X2 [Hippocampus zosterae]|uniref:transcription factor 7-like 1-A isoform X2 n=1 Tax=Hippocampus zosterae TaxID=109293 RepID=UPI00223DE5FF|nr:transcription factor 7-like 1-A isoform X2 [Hippocampus zosterae]
MEKLREEFEQIVGELEWQDVADTLQELCSNIMCEPSNTPPPHPAGQRPPSNPPPSAAYAGMPFDARPQPARFPPRLPFVPHAQLPPLAGMRYGPQFNPYLVHPFHLSRQGGAPFRLQYLPCQMTPQVVHSQPAFSFPTAPPQPKKSLPVVPLPEGATLHAVGMLNGEVLYAAVDASQPAPAPLPPATCARSSSRKRKRKRRRKSAAAKKPPDAFMCFLRERRSASKSPSEQKDGVAVNKRLAQLWTSLSKEQRAKYYQQAYVEKKLREQMSSDSGSGDDDEDDRVACPRSCREGLSDGLTCAPGPEKKRRRCDAAKHQGGDACNTGDDAPASSCSSLGSSSSSSSSSSSLSSWLEAVIAAEGAESPAAPRPASPAPNKCPDSGDESDIEGMDAKLLHLLGCC